MRESGPASVSLIVCETVLDEKSGITSAIRIMDVLYIGRRAALARFFVIAYLHSRAGDLGNHTGTVQMSGKREGRWTIVADVPPYPFNYSYRLDPGGPGGFMLTTEFNLDLTTFGELGTFGSSFWLMEN
jgi:hypothetical protein